MIKIIKIFLILLLSLSLGGCGTTKIVTDRNINAEIYVNGVKRGMKQVEIKRTGPPQEIQIMAKYQGKIIGNIVEKRKFDLTTCLVGYFTYGFGLLFAWRYPEIILIPTNGLDIDQISPWDQPLKSNWGNSSDQK